MTYIYTALAIWAVLATICAYAACVVAGDADRRGGE